MPSVVAQAIEEISDDPHQWASIAENLLQDRALRASRSAMHVVAALMRVALGDTSPQHPLRRHYVRYYGAALGVLAQDHGDLGTIEEANAVFLAEVDRQPAEDPLRRLVYHGLERMARLRQERDPGTAATDGLVQAQLRLVSVLSSDDPGIVGVMAALGTSFLDRYELTADPDAAAQAVQWSRRALERADAGYPEPGRLLHTAVRAMRVWHEITGDSSALVEAGRLIRIAVERHAAEWPDPWVPQAILADILRQQYEACGDTALIDEAIGHLHACISALPVPKGVNAALLSGSLGNAWRARYQQTGDVAHLHQAVSALRQAVSELPDAHPNRDILVTNLSGVLYLWSDRTGDEDVLEEAVRLRRAAGGRGRTTLDGVRALNMLGSNLLRRFWLTHDRRALTDALDVLRDAVAATPEGHPHLSGPLCNLATAEFFSHIHSGEIGALDRSIALSRRALAGLPAQHPHRWGTSSELAKRLHRRYRRVEDVAAIEEAAVLVREVVAGTPKADPDRPTFLTTAAIVLTSRYERTRRADHLDEAIEVARAGLQGLPTVHAKRSDLMSALANSLATRYFESGNQACGREARSLFLSASRAHNSPANQINLARMAANLSKSFGDWRSVTEALERAISLLPRAASRRLGRDDQERQLAGFGTLAQEACASALQVEDPELALTLLEQGRGVLLAQTLETRSDLTDLRDLHPATAERLEALRDRLARAPREMVSAANGQADDYYELDREWDRAVAEIRLLPGFDRFLFSPTIDEMLTAARQGPIILFSIGEIRSDALLVTTEGIEVVPLPGVTPADVQDQTRRFLAAVEPESPAPDETTTRPEPPRLSRTLEWLWDAIAHPIMTRLGLDGRPDPDSPWPRVWWCPSGPLSLLPLHAAGHHRTTSEVCPQTVMDRAISSYTPTIRALLHARRHRRPASGATGVGGSRRRPTGRALVVAAPYTPGADALRGAEREVEILRSQFSSGSATVLGRPDARRERVLAELPAHDFAHFACHAFSDAARPSASHLLLGHDDARLTVLDIAALRLDRAELAYLSACATARAAMPLADEAIHLASAFQLAGFRQVVATLWHVHDRPAVRVAKNVYRQLTDDGTASVAQALHSTTRALRDRWPGHPEIWASHIHAGA
ncbi:CHAT domain-containing protein [Micromonospora haikouensis]|uniref:CHAT domain-containing protein n=1 Tax=Micromonospora haikouensis TaxID=686309 RepID=UPI0036CF15C1